MIFLNAILYLLVGVLFTASIAVVAPVLLSVILVVSAMLIPICMAFKVIKFLRRK